jgi:hypothetical protein
LRCEELAAKGDLERPDEQTFCGTVVGDLRTTEEEIEVDFASGQKLTLSFVDKDYSLDYPD